MIIKFSNYDKNIQFLANMFRLLDISMTNLLIIL